MNSIRKCLVRCSVGIVLAGSLASMVALPVRSMQGPMVPSPKLPAPKWPAPPGTIYCSDGSMIYPDGCIVYPNGYYVYPNGDSGYICMK